MQHYRRTVVPGWSGREEVNDREREKARKNDLLILMTMTNEADIYDNGCLEFGRQVNIFKVTVIAIAMYNVCS